MKRIITYFIIISLLWGCVGNGNVVSAKAKISPTLLYTSGAKKKDTEVYVKNLATELGDYNYPGEYAQVADDGHYYYLRQTGKNSYYTLYRDKGKKVGSFKVTFEEIGSDWNASFDWEAFGWHKGKLYVDFTSVGYRQKRISVVDFKKKSIKTICTLEFPSSYKEGDMINMSVYLYQNKVYAASYNRRSDYKIREFDMSSGKLLNTFSGPKLKKNEDLFWEAIADGKIYYIKTKKKGKKYTSTLRCIDMASNKDKKAIPSASNMWQATGVRQASSDFTWNKKYYFYIDKKHRLHRQNRKTDKDEIISGIKVSRVDCTKKGLYVQKYDKWFIEGEGEEHANTDYAPALYFMNFNGKNVKKIAKYTTGHYSYHGWTFWR